MRTFLSLSFASLFVFLAAFNVWSMLAGAGSSPRSTKIRIQAHRISGYVFIALFVILLHFMLLRLKGWPDELSPRLVLHMSLAFAIAPLLAAKVLLVRYQKGSRTLLSALGILIFALSFALVSMNVAVHFLRLAAAHKLGILEPTLFVVVVLGFLGLTLYTRLAGSQSDSVESALSTALSAQNWNNHNAALTLTLARVEAQTHDAKTLRFVLPANSKLLARPGQFLTFQLAIDGKTAIRSYSICSSPTQTAYIEITPKRVEKGLVSQFLNDHAHPGLTAKATGPFGKFFFDEARHKRIVLIAGGSGITPMMAILRYIDDRCLPVQCTLIYCARTMEDLFFRAELGSWQLRWRNFHYVSVLSKPDAQWTGWKGRLRREILEREIEDEKLSTFFLCGPPAFMENGRNILLDMSVNTSHILQESFGSAVDLEKKEIPDQGSLNLRFARSVGVFTISPDKTILESSESHGVLIPSGCRQGSCGTCATRLLDGNVDIKNAEALTEEMRSQGYILPCVSRPLTDITLDA